MWKPGGKMRNVVETTRDGRMKETALTLRVIGVSAFGFCLAEVALAMPKTYQLLPTETAVLRPGLGSGFEAAKNN